MLLAPLAYPQDLRLENDTSGSTMATLVWSHVNTSHESIRGCFCGYRVIIPTTLFRNEFAMLVIIKFSLKTDIFFTISTLYVPMDISKRSSMFKWTYNSKQNCYLLLDSIWTCRHVVEIWSY